MPRENSGDEKSGSGSRHVLEWIVAGLGALIVIGSISFLAYKAVKNNQLPPNLNFRIIAVTPVSGGYLVQFSVLNKGDKTAAQLKLTASLMKGSDIVETSDASLDYAPANSVRRAGAFFSHDPRQYEIHISAKGYAEP